MPASKAYLGKPEDDSPRRAPSMNRFVVYNFEALKNTTPPKARDEAWSAMKQVAIIEPDAEPKLYTIPYSKTWRDVAGFIALGGVVLKDRNRQTPYPFEPGE